MDKKSRMTLSSWCMFRAQYDKYAAARSCTASLGKGKNKTTPHPTKFSRYSGSAREIKTSGGSGTRMILDGWQIIFICVAIVGTPVKPGKAVTRGESDH